MTVTNSLSSWEQSCQAYCFYPIIQFTNTIYLTSYCATIHGKTGKEVLISFIFVSFYRGRQTFIFDHKIPNYQAPDRITFQVYMLNLLSFINIMMILDENKLPSPHNINIYFVEHRQLLAKVVQYKYDVSKQKKFMNIQFIFLYIC